MSHVQISVLSHTFRQEADDTAAIVNFKHAVDTLEGAKSDSAFLYQPPFKWVSGAPYTLYCRGRR